MAQVKKKRFRYFVDKPFQIKFILNFVVLVLISALVSLGFVVYIDSQKFSKGVLFEELVRDFYKTTDLSYESMKLRNNLARLSLTDEELKNRALFGVDSYIRELARTEEDIKKAINLRKILINKLSLSIENNLFSVINEAIKSGKINSNVVEGIDIKTEITGWRIDVEKGVQECDFEPASVVLTKIVSLLAYENDVKVALDFKKNFDEYRILVEKSYSFIKKQPEFLKDIDNIVSTLSSQGMVDSNVISSLSTSASKIKSLIGSVGSYSDVLYYETRTYGKKAYNLLDLYWKPILLL
ncbi:MAG: hypothetical protein ACK4F9_06445, partial [Brevinematia bacterium]